MIPGDTSPRSASHAPRPSIIDCRNRRSVLVITGFAARARLFDEVRGLCGRLAGFLLEPTGAGLIEQRDREQQASGEHCQHPEHPVKEWRRAPDHMLSPAVVAAAANTKSSASRSATATFSNRTEPAP